MKKNKISKVLTVLLVVTAGVASFSVGLSIPTAIALTVKKADDASFGIKGANTYTVTFYKEYSESEWSNPTVLNVLSGQAIESATNLSLDGYQFLGWRTLAPSSEAYAAEYTTAEVNELTVSSNLSFYPVFKSNAKKVSVNSNYYEVNTDVVLETSSIGQTLIGYQYLGVDGVLDVTASWNDSRNLYSSSGIYKFIESDGAAVIQRKVGFRPNTQWSQAWDNNSCGFGIYAWQDDSNNASVHLGNSNGYTLYGYIPANYDNFKFSRYSSNNNAFAWGNESGNFSFSSTSWSNGSYSKDSIILEMNTWSSWVDNWDGSNARWIESDEIQRDVTLDSQPVNDIHQTKQYNYLKDPDWTSINTYKPNLDNVDESKPRALELDFSGVESAGTYYVEIGKNKDLSDARILTTTSNSLSWNPEIGTDYYYRVATSEAGLESASIKQYYVANIMPRNLNLGGLRNVRDIGGWPTSLVPNGFVKQGLYYRGAQFNSGNYGATPTFSSSDLDEVHRLGIKVDIDMRNTNKQPTGNYSPASTDEYPISIVKATMPDGTESTRFSGFNTEWCNIFNAIANADNEHVYLHCTYGADRTGIASFALLALLGVSVEDLGRDYEFTRLDGQRGVNHAENYAFDSWVTETNKLSGATFADKMKAHLISKGLTEHTLEHIREIFIDGYVAQA